MATPAESTPPTDKLDPKFQPPDLPAVQLWQPKKPQRKLSPWHWVAITLGALIVVPCTVIGAYTVGQWAFNDPPSVINLATAKPTATPKPTPSYDLAGYQTAIHGPQEQAYASALAKLSVDIRQPDYPAAVNDAPALVTAANAWLNQIRAINVPPAYAAGKLNYVTAAIIGRRAAHTIQKGLTTGNMIVLQRGADQIAKALRLTYPTAPSTPTNTPIGS